MSTTALGTPFQEEAGSPKITMRGDWVEATRTFIVPWAFWQTFCYQLVGTWTFSGTIPVFVPPIAFPAMPAMVCRDVTVECQDPETITTNITSPLGVDLGANTNSYTNARITAKYITLYDPANSDRADMPQVPTGTYMTYSADMGADVVQLPSRALYWGNTYTPPSGQVFTGNITLTIPNFFQLGAATNGQLSSCAIQIGILTCTLDGSNFSGNLPTNINGTLTGGIDATFTACSLNAATKPITLTTGSINYSATTLFKDGTFRGTWEIQPSAGSSTDELLVITLNGNTTGSPSSGLTPSPPVGEDNKPGILVPSGDFNLSWKRVPQPPWDAIDSARGKLNQDYFLSNPPGTVLFVGFKPTRQWQFFQNPFTVASSIAAGDTMRIWDVDYHFAIQRHRLNTAIPLDGPLYAPVPPAKVSAVSPPPLPDGTGLYPATQIDVGWNYFYKDGDPLNGEHWCKMVDTNSKPPYDYADFTPLFNFGATNY